MGSIYHGWPTGLTDYDVTRRPFVLIAGTVIGLILFIGGSVSLLYTVGGQELPSVLMGGAVIGRKD